ncbi:RNA polymerase sigma factor [Nisaea acidiphila]|uniref:RNA polymerase sigma factor n=1 Tax=Nisaea acidiphila TaxID=1862145 RepID=A0A9J7ALK2_9PROT|nr:RNA polymerase sigma factor [Nisaea acidiphila]UUX48038.1 RNA polymerase sigma factor [Nisaea acidiphila]
MSGDLFAEATRSAVDLIARSAEGFSRQVPVREIPPPPISPKGERRTPQPPEAFWELWSEHQSQLLRQCMRLMSGNMADAEDALGNALVRASSHFAEGGGEGIANQRAWLSRLVHNSCIDFYRARSRQKRWTDEVMAMADGDDIPSAPTPEPTPEEIAETGESMRKLQTELNKLPELLRVPLILRFLEGLSYAEIAERLCIPNCTARKRVQLARERLRRNGAAPT